MTTTIVLSYLKILYLVLTVIVLSLMAYYVRGLTSKSGLSGRAKALFYGWVLFLAAAGISFHLLTAWQIPWVHWELKRGTIKPEREIVINMKEHKFILPDKALKIKQGEVVIFKVFSDDLTYGFGAFRGNGAMEFQMQVLPGHSNDIIWVFTDPGKYSIRSTEYSGVESPKMYLKDAIEIYAGKEGGSHD